MLRRKVLLNLAIIFICGTIAISLPVIASHLATKPTHADQQTTTDWEVCSVFVGEQYQNQLDNCVIWQIQCRQDTKIIETWSDIYALICADTTLIEYDPTQLQLTPYGLVYRKLKTTADYQTFLQSGYQTVVTYKNHRCLLTLS